MYAPPMSRYFQARIRARTKTNEHYIGRLPAMASDYETWLLNIAISCKVCPEIHTEKEKIDGFGDAKQ
jgi:hypothetical protein